MMHQRTYTVTEMFQLQLVQTNDRFGKQSILLNIYNVISLISIHVSSIVDGNDTIESEQNSN